MPLSTLLDAGLVLPSLKVQGKKQFLHELARTGSQVTQAREEDLFQALLDREKLGSTGVGHGVAIPHVKVDGISAITGIFARLETPVDFDAIDDQPVDLAFFLMAPVSVGGEHLNALARISRTLRDAALREMIRDCRSADAIRAVFQQYGDARAA